MQPRVLCLSLLLLSACGASGSPATHAAPGADGGVDAPGPDVGVDAPADAPSPPMDLSFEGGFLRRAFPRAEGGYVVLVEPPMSLRIDNGFPRREIRWVDVDGRERRARVGPAADEQLLDLAAHPSGALSVLFASDAGYRVLRLAPDGAQVAALALVDPSIDADPPQLAPGAGTGPIETASHDTGRLAAHGDDVVLATRTARHSVVAYRLRLDGAALRPVYRTLVFPPSSMMPLGLNGGSYDTFGQVDAQYSVHVAVDGAGRAYVGVRYPDLSHQRYPRLVGQAFGESLVVDGDGLDSFVARLAPTGERLGTSVVTTDLPDELYGLRADADGAWALGRNEIWNASGTGHDALVARIDGATGLVSTRAFDVSRGDLACDLAPMPDGGVVVVGAAGYQQNPSGASISEASTAFARWLRADGSAIDLAVPAGPRHNEARFVAVVGETLVVGGMHDGPGTHSADADPTLLRARGFLAELPMPVP